MNRKAFKNYTIAQRPNSSWWDISRDGQFLKMAATEEEARRVVWMETGKGEYITDDMMTPVPYIDSKDSGDEMDIFSPNDTSSVTGGD
jgi:hypothetical protein